MKAGRPLLSACRPHHYYHGSAIRGVAANTEGVSFVLEAGHENDAEAEQCFYDVRKLHKLEGILRSVSFVGKEDCRAVQMADLLAFYTRRHGVTCSPMKAWDFS